MKPESIISEKSKSKVINIINSDICRDDIRAVESRLLSASDFMVVINEAIDRVPLIDFKYLQKQDAVEYANYIKDRLLENGVLSNEEGDKNLDLRARNNLEAARILAGLQEIGETIGVGKSREIPGLIKDLGFKVTSASKLDDQNYKGRF